MMRFIRLWVRMGFWSIIGEFLMRGGKEGDLRLKVS